MRISDWSSDVCSSDLMIVDAYAQPSARFDDVAGGVDILLDGRRVAAGMIVHQNERGRTQVDGSANHLTHIDCRLIYGAIAHIFIPEQHVAAVELQNADALHRHMRHVVY